MHRMEFMSKKKIPVQEAMPLSSLFDTEGFQRNYEFLMREQNNSTLQHAITSELVSNATANVKRSQVNTISAQGDRKKKPTKDVLLKFKAKWESDYYLNHGVETARGWKKAAIYEFGLSAKTLNIILDEI